MIEYRFRVPSAAVFTLYSYSKTLEYHFRVSTAASLTAWSLEEDRMASLASCVAVAWRDDGA
jgi:hypothetical protein